MQVYTNPTHAKPSDLFFFHLLQTLSSRFQYLNILNDSTKYTCRKTNRWTFFKPFLLLIILHFLTFTPPSPHTCPKSQLTLHITTLYTGPPLFQWHGFEFHQICHRPKCNKHHLPAPNENLCPCQESNPRSLD